MVAPTTAISAVHELSEAVRSALFVNLLTEDNLPYYFRDHRADVRARRRLRHMEPPLDGRGGSPLDRDPRLPHRHSRDRSGAARAGPHGARCPVAKCPPPVSPLAGVVYVTLQELATRIAHRNTGKVIGDKCGYDVMARVAADENLHYLFYRDLGTAALELDPVGDGGGDGRGRAQLRHAGHRHPRLRSPQRGDLPGRHLRRHDPPRAGVAAGDPASLAGPAPRASQRCRRARLAKRCCSASSGWATSPASSLPGPSGATATSPPPDTTSLTHDLPHTAQPSVPVVALRRTDRRSCA